MRWGSLSRALLLCPAVLFICLHIGLHHTYRAQVTRSFSGADVAANQQTDQHIYTTEKLRSEFKQSGWLFNHRGRSFKLIKNVATSVVHSFSPYLDQEVEKRFLYHLRNSTVFILSPSVIFNDGGELIFVSRVWHHKWQHVIIKSTGVTIPAHLDNVPDNCIYMQRFDNKMRPVRGGEVLGISSAWRGLDDGPYDPRLFKIRGKVYMTFNAEIRVNQSFSFDPMHLWDFDENLPVTFKIKGGSPIIKLRGEQVPRDKNWSSFVRNGQLYFVYTYDPLTILHCTLTGNCEFVGSNKKQTSSGKFFTLFSSHLRGGTPFVYYTGNYYVSFAHSTLHTSKDTRSRIYHTHMVVLHAADPYRIVYVSDPVHIHHNVYKDAPQAANTASQNFFFPVSLVMEDADSFVMGAHINDRRSILIRVAGVQALLERVIHLDRVHKPKDGAPIGYLHRHVYETIRNITKLKFLM